MAIRSGDYISGGISTFGREYVQRNGESVAVYRVSSTEDGAAYLCRDASGKGPLRRYKASELSRSPAVASCLHCGHPVPAPGVTLSAEQDVDVTGLDRPRCQDTACAC